MRGCAGGNSRDRAAPQRAVVNGDELDQRTASMESQRPLPSVDRDAPSQPAGAGPRRRVWSGELLAVLATHVREVHGIDVDHTMRESAIARCAGLPNVTVDGTPLGDVTGPFDLVTMVAVLHHLDIDDALSDVARILTRGGHFLSVGLARLASLADHAWDAAWIVTNPAIGYVKHPWVSTQGVQPARDPDHGSTSDLRRDSWCG